MKIWKIGMGRDEEKEVIEMLAKHAQTTHATMELFHKMMDLVFASKFHLIDEFLVQIKEHERACDAIHHQITASLFEGAFLPVMRSQLYRLSDMMDNVTDAIDNASHMAPYFKVHKLTPKLRDILQRLVLEAEKSAVQLQVVLRSLLDKDADAVFKEKYAVMKQAEEACDHIQKEMFDVLYLDKKLNPTLVQLAGNFGHTISTIADNVEYSCDAMAAIKMLRHA